MRTRIVEQARACLGTPFHHLGRQPGVGLDCAGLIICVARSLGVVAPDFDVPVYARQPDGHSLIKLCDRHMRRVPQARMQPGDVIVVIVDRDPQHMGFLGDYRHGGLSIIHAASRADGKGEVIETRLMFSRAQRFVAAYAMPGVE